MSVSVFKKLSSSSHKSRTKGYQFAPLLMIFGVKVDLRRKVTLVIGVHIVHSYRQDVYESTMKSVSSRILMLITASNNLEVITGDIGNSYLNANIKGNIYTCSGANFEVVGIISERNLLEVVKVLYGLPTIRNRWHAHLLHTLREMGFKPTRFDPDVCIRECEWGYDYIRMHTDDVLVVAVNPTSIVNLLC